MGLAGPFVTKKFAYGLGGEKPVRAGACGRQQKTEHMSRVEFRELVKMHKKCGNLTENFVRFAIDKKPACAERARPATYKNNAKSSARKPGVFH